MNRNKQLAKNSIIITVSRILTQVVSFLLLPLYTSILTTSEYGIVDLLNTYVVILRPIVTLQLEGAIFRFLIESREDELTKRKYISTTILATFIQAIIVLLIFQFFSMYVSSDYKYYLIINVIAHAIAEMSLQISRGLGDNKSYAIGNSIISISMIVLNIFFVLYLRAGVEGLLISSIVANLLCGIYIFFSKRIYNYLKWTSVDLNTYKLFLAYSLPLIPNSLSWWLISASDRTIINIFLGSSVNGIYAAANKFSGLFVTFYNLFNVAWTESVALAFGEKDSESFINNTINLMFKFFSSISMVLLAIMPFIFPIFISEKFAEAYYHIPILMIGAILNVGIGLISVIYIAKKDTKKIANTSILAGIINIVINFILIKHIGLYAASLSTAIAYLVLLVYRYIEIRKSFKLQLDFKMIFSLIVVFIVVLYGYYSANIILQFSVLILVLIYSIIILHKNIIQLLSMLKKK